MPIIIPPCGCINNLLRRLTYFTQRKGEFKCGNVERNVGVVSKYTVNVLG